MDDTAKWLLEWANYLNSDHILPVPIIDIIKESDIKVNFVVSQNPEKRALLRVDANSKYTIEIYRNKQYHAIQPSERFSLAHELAHIILLRADYAIPETKSEYHKIENYCNYFAENLLLPKTAFSHILPKKSIELIYHCNKICELCKVSLPVLGQRMPKVLNNIGLCEGTITKNVNKRGIYSLKWGCSSIKQLLLQPKKHFGAETFLGQEAMSWYFTCDHLDANQTSKEFSNGLIDVTFIKRKMPFNSILAFIIGRD